MTFKGSGYKKTDCHNAVFAISGTSCSFVLTFSLWL